MSLFKHLLMGRLEVITQNIDESYIINESVKMELINVKDRCVVIENQLKIANNKNIDLTIHYDELSNIIMGEEESKKFNIIISILGFISVLYVLYNSYLIKGYYSYIIIIGAFISLLLYLYPLYKTYNNKENDYE